MRSPEGVSGETLRVPQLERIAPRDPHTGDPQQSREPPDEPNTVRWKEEPPLTRLTRLPTELGAVPWESRPPTHTAVRNAMNSEFIEAN